MLYERPEAMAFQRERDFLPLLVGKSHTRPIGIPQYLPIFHILPVFSHFIKPRRPLSSHFAVGTTHPSRYSYHIIYKQKDKPRPHGSAAFTWTEHQGNDPFYFNISFTWKRALAQRDEKKKWVVFGPEQWQFISLT